MRLKATIFFSLLVQILFAQNISNIDYIKFNYNASVILYSEIQITITTNYLNNNSLEIIYYKNQERKIKKLNINDEEFKSIIYQFNKIKNADLIENFSFGLDGAITEIEIGSFFSNSINYKLWGVDKSQLNTSLKDFILTAQLILKFAGVKIDEYN